ncbi:MAG TPA: CDP-alcohol phosphatidyltransferase family protein [Candidatus Dormibacteraeota bacterium]|nr:CDP-alcohol phosphatidyltransferase family protein [Candidatus Dormibacteraeota bacterium]
MFTTRFQAWVRRNAQRLALFMGRLPITPNQVTVAGSLFTFGAAVLIGVGYLQWAGLVLAVSGTFDILDGALARATKRSYPYGAFLDSTFDRYSEGAVYIGLAVYFLGRRDSFMRWAVLACLLALAGSFLVSYVRARAQSLGFKCDSGIFARPERVVVTVAGLVIGGSLGPPVASWVLVGVVVLLAVLTNFTAVQRILEVWGQARAQRRAREAAAKAPARGETSRP